MKPQVEKQQLAMKELCNRLNSEAAHLPQKDNAYQFLQDLMHIYMVKTPSLHISHDIEFDWSTERAELQAIFYQDNTWSVHLKKEVYVGDGPDPSFVIAGHPYFVLKDEFVDEISTKEPFEQTYDPILSGVKILWSTNKYDGPLSGYCEYFNELYYFDVKEELEYSPSARMYAVYQLSKWERMKAWWDHFRWTVTLKNKVLWFFYMLRFKSRMKNYDHEKYQQKKQEWEANHKIIGYFTG